MLNLVYVSAKFANNKINKRRRQKDERNRLPGKTRLGNDRLRSRVEWALNSAHHLLTHSLKPGFQLNATHATHATQPIALRALR